MKFVKRVSKPHLLHDIKILQANVNVCSLANNQAFSISVPN